MVREQHIFPTRSYPYRYRRRLLVNRDFTQLFGYTPEETLGRRINELSVPDEFQNEFQNEFQVDK